MKRFTSLLLSLLVIVTTLGSTALHADAMNEFQTKLNNARGKVVYLDFWASWCKPCRHSFPWMNQMKAQYEAQGLAIITVNLDKDKVLAEQFLKENPADFDIIYDPSGSIARQFKLKGMPMSFTFDRAGKPVKSHVGFNDEKKAQYEAELLELLQQAPK
jgi:thiol-disulfide isomerase/thioredoxin